MDNQQGRLFRLGWFVGGLESEGCFTLSKSCRNKRGYRYTPLVDIVNSEDRFIAFCSSVLKEYEIPHYIYKRRNTCGKILSKKGIVSIMVRGYQRVKKLLTLIEPYVQVKKEQANLLHQFIDYRLSVPMKQPYGEYEDSVHLKMKELNRTLRDYTPNTEIGDDIVRSHMKV